MNVRPLTNTAQVYAGGCQAGRRRIWARACKAGCRAGHDGSREKPGHSMSLCWLYQALRIVGQWPPRFSGSLLNEGSFRARYLSLLSSAPCCVVQFVACSDPGLSRHLASASRQAYGSCCWSCCSDPAVHRGGEACRSGWLLLWRSASFACQPCTHRCGRIAMVWWL